MEHIVTWIVNTVSSWGYLGIFIMMTLESSFIPFPSEVAMIPAGYLSSIGEMNFFISLTFGTLGALFGASINYFLGFTFGEKIVHKLIQKYGKYFLIGEKDYQKAETFFQKHGSFTTFTGRFIPAIRQLISIPAGVLKMNFPKFIFYTGIGAGIWNMILLTIGYIAGENKAIILQYSKETTIGVLLGVFALTCIYIAYNKLGNSKN